MHYRFSIIGRYCQVPTLEHFATPLSHARDSMDWAMVRWLLENGADPDIKKAKGSFPLEVIYNIGTSQAEVNNIYHGIVEQVQQNIRVRE